MFIAHKSKAVGAQHRAGVNHHTAAQRRTRIDDDTRVQVTIVANYDALADDAARSGVRALSHDGVRLDYGVGVNGGAGSDLRRSMNDSRGMNASRISSGRMEQRSGQRECQPGIGRNQQGLAPGGLAPRTLPR